jgi:ketosteroid isomerase-like protein
MGDTTVPVCAQEAPAGTPSRAWSSKGSRMTSSAAPISFATGGNSTELIELLNQQRVLYEAIRRLSSQQASTVASGDAESLLNLLSQRQHLLDRIGQITTGLEKYRQHWRAVCDALSKEDQLQVSKLVEQAQESLAAIIEQDEIDRRALEQTKAEMGKNIVQASKAGLAMAAYGSRAPKPTPRFTNHQG